MRRLVPARLLRPGDVLLRGAGRPCVIEAVEVFLEESRSRPWTGAVIVRYRGAETATGSGWESFKPDESVSVAHGDVSARPVHNNSTTIGHRYVG